MSSVNISNQNVQVNPTTTENKINVVTTTENNISVTQPSIQTVEILTGPQGPAGPSGSQGPQGDSFPYTGSAEITGSLGITGSLDVDSAFIQTVTPKDGIFIIDSPNDSAYGNFSFTTYTPSLGAYPAIVTGKQFG